MALTPYGWGKLIRVRFVAQGLDQSKYPVNVAVRTVLTGSHLYYYSDRAHTALPLSG